VRSGWHLIGPDGEWWNTFATKGEAQDAVEEEAGGKTAAKDTCKRCGNPFQLGWIVTRQGGSPVATMSGNNHTRGVTCKDCARKRVTELTNADRAKVGLPPLSRAGPD
jgi:hypothetical protein